MRPLVIVVSIVAAISFFWVVEPYAYNPVGASPPKVIEILNSNTCLINNRKLDTNAGPILQHYMATGKFVGVSAGIYQEGCGSYALATGVRDKRNVEPFTLDTVNRIASITKPMTAIAIMQLYERGLINLDAPIQTYLPEFPTQDTPITIRHLLSHTSGIAHYSSWLDAISFHHYSSLENAVSYIAQREFLSDAGMKYHYSSYGYVLLGLIIEKVSQLSFENYLVHNIWRKAGMEHTSLESNTDLAKKSRLYLNVAGIFIRSPYTDLSIIYPAGGVQSTVLDLLKFGQGIINNTFIKRSTLALMIDVRDSLAVSAGDDPYGLGWSVYRSPKNGLIISHGGAQPGASAHFQILLDKKIVVLALSNAYGTKKSTYRLANELGSILL